MDSLQKVTAELEPFINESDAVFIEYPSETPDIRDYLWLLMQIPLLLLGNMFIGLFVHYPLFVLFNRDILSTEMAALKRLQSERDFDFHAVDEHPLYNSQSASPEMIALNWVPFAVVIGAAPTAGLITVTLGLVGIIVPVLVRRAGYRKLSVGLFALSLLGAGAVVVAGYLSVWLVLTAAVAWNVLVLATVNHRNDVMLDRVEQISAENGYEDPVLITGKAHLGGMARIAAERGIEISKAHVSMSREEGLTHTSFEPSDLPESPGPLDSQAIIPESERTVVTRRLGAFAVDAVVVALISAVGYLQISDILTRFAGPTFAPPLAVGMVSILVSWIGYAAVAEVITGQTIGKRAFGLLVVTTDGDTIGRREALIRALALPVDVFGALLSMVVSDRRQRFGDRLAGTIVGKRTTGEADRDGEGAQAAIIRKDAKARTYEVIPGSEKSVFARRALAKVIDTAIVALLSFLTWFIVGTILTTLVKSDAAEERYLLVSMALVWLTTTTVYHVLPEWRYGRTAGKVYLGLSVADSNGQPLSMRAAIIRNVLRPIDALGGYLIGAFMVLFTRRSQRLGDLAAGTIVGKRTTGEADRDEVNADIKSRTYGIIPGSEKSVFARRAIAKIVDTAIGAALSFLAWFAVAIILGVLEVSDAAGKHYFFVSLPLVWLTTTTVYHILPEWRYGTTVGKKLVGLGVADSNGQPLSMRAAIIRNVLRPIDALVGYLIGAFMVLFTRQSQRLGDLAAGTIVGKRTTDEVAPAGADDQTEVAENV